MKYKGKLSEMKKLQEENEKLRKEIGKSDVDWALINDLIENELEQEELCGE